jgi:integrase
MDKSVDLSAYTAKHRTRQHGIENGSVKAVGKKVKKWQGIYHVYDDKGSRITRRVILGEYSKMTKTQAKENLRVMLRRREEEPAAATAQATVSLLCDDYFAIRKGDWEESTQQCVGSLFQLVKASLGDKPVEKVTAENLKRFVNELPNRKYTMQTTFYKEGKPIVVTHGKAKTGISISYMKKIITHLRGIFDLAQERDLVTKNPARSISVRLRAPKLVTKPDKSILPFADVPRLLAQFTMRDTLIISISLFGGTRPNELFALKGGDVGQDKIYIQRALNRKREAKETKTAKSREVSVPPETMQLLRDWIVANGIGNNDLVFVNRAGNPMNRANFLNRQLRGAARRAGIPLAVDFQMLRRTWATMADASGMPLKAIQAQLGHSRPDMTLTEYIQPVDAIHKEHVARMEAIFLGRQPLTVDAAEKLASRLVQ